ncbi:uncharacterized protein LOC129232114, partial [Uloborus diversus]|uniref:uncharacterized protein LOC129232114 n=1 Tax=Uloborus diversus TaxID=327109 RepID=UPI0024091FC3
WLEPTDVSNADRMFQRGSKWCSSLSYASPNLNELKVMYSAILGQHPPPTSGSALEDLLTYAGYLGKPLLTGNFHTLLVTLGCHGVVLVTTLTVDCLFPVRGSEISKGEFRIVHYPAPNVEGIISVSGAGDCFAAGMITGILQRLSPSKCIEAGKRAAALSLHSHLAVPQTMCPEMVLPS